MFSYSDLSCFQSVEEGGGLNVSNTPLVKHAQGACVYETPHPRAETQLCVFQLFTCLEHIFILVL